MRQLRVDCVRAWMREGWGGGFVGCGKTILARMAEQRAEGSR